MSSLVEKVNIFVRESFGKGFIGNYRQGITAEDTPGMFFKSDTLSLIGRRPLFSIPLMVIGIEAIDIVGKFTNMDGSEIKTHPKYQEQCEKYAKLYETHFGKRVNIGYY